MFALTFSRSGNRARKRERERRIPYMRPPPAIEERGGECSLQERGGLCSISISCQDAYALPWGARHPGVNDLFEPTQVDMLGPRCKPVNVTATHIPQTRWRAPHGFALAISRSGKRSRFINHCNGLLNLLGVALAVSRSVKCLRFINCCNGLLKIWVSGFRD